MSTGDLSEAPDPEDLDAIEIAITDTLDLHSFRPAEVAGVVHDYLDAAWDKGLRELRIIHGRGIGAQRRTVRKVLERDERVTEISDAADGSGWGATVVKLG